MVTPAVSSPFLKSSRAEITSLEQSTAVRDSIRQPVAVKRKKSPNGAMLRSLAFPGWGQWYNEQYIKAVLVFGGQGFLTGLAVHYTGKVSGAAEGSAERDFYIDQRNQTYWFMAGVMLLSMLDAYIDAHLYDFDSGPELSLRIGPVYSASSSVTSHPSMFGLSIRAGF